MVVNVKNIDKTVIKFLESSVPTQSV